MASAVNDTARELGSALGIAVLGSAINQAYRDGMAAAVADLPGQLAERVRSSIAFTQSPAVAQAGAAGRPRGHGAAGIPGRRQPGMLTAAAVLVVAAVVVFRRSPAAPVRAARRSEKEAAPVSG